MQCFFDAVEDVSAPAPPGVYGLFQIADTEESTRTVTVGRDLFCQWSQNFPLLSAGVLKLIHKHVLYHRVQSEVEIMPCGRPAFGKMVDQDARQIAEEHDPMLVLQSFEGCVVLLQQGVGGFGPVAKAAQLDAARVVDQWLQGSEPCVRNWYASERGISGKYPGHHRFFQERPPSLR